MLSFLKVGQRSRSRSCDQNFCCHQKDLDVRNTHAKYESPMSNGKKVICRVPNVGHRSRSRSRAQKLWYLRKDLVIRNTHAKYESPFSNGKKVISKPSDRRTTDKVIPQWRSASPAQQKSWYGVKCLVTRNALEIWKLYFFWFKRYMTIVLRTFMFRQNKNHDRMPKVFVPKREI